jgi:hypothetical protein
MQILSGHYDMKVDQELTPEEMYRAIYDGTIGVKAFRAWISYRLQQAYDKGVRDADAPPSYDEVSRSQYD